MEFPTSLSNILPNVLAQMPLPSLQNFSISVLIPACNEEKGIGKVIEGFRHAIPSAEIFVYDNNSSDRTAEKAEKMGAIVRHEFRQGKGNVVRRMFLGWTIDRRDLLPYRPKNLNRLSHSESR